MNPQLMTRILFATDFSDCSGRAQEYAMYLATAWDAKLDVLPKRRHRPVLRRRNAFVAKDIAAIVCVENRAAIPGRRDESTP